MMNDQSEVDLKQEAGLKKKKKTAIVLGKQENKKLVVLSQLKIKSSHIFVPFLGSKVSGQTSQNVLTCRLSLSGVTKPSALVSITNVIYECVIFFLFSAYNEEECPPTVIW